MKLLTLTLSFIPGAVLGFGGVGCDGPCCRENEYIKSSETECVLSKDSSSPCPSGWSDQVYQCVLSGVSGTCCIPDPYAVTSDQHLVEYCKINEVQNTEWYEESSTHCPEGFGYGEQYNALGECKQGDRK
eukprot:CAMPEP_0182453332 /NCGR_PEP_ID=MMETSP1319-20130603/439_1 /TAXON_ID=172717 /ORGANISM="Bolidomonas pacifica, Strain RCC208" /LENGTH=129 /DNA_ID=CAMNT_0024651251 /DNA_START=24 /DNA_END=410 /DNA_ORIENTATION=-